MTRELPLALAPWRAWLGWFDAALAERLGDLVMRLDELAGPRPAPPRRGDDMPDGLGDLRTRGAYERLLATEWLLADEAPDEFLRRATAAEHLFLAHRQQAPVVDRSFVALFDAGPRQLGAPRLAHLAAWILLARRAELGGGRLRWGIWQRPGELHDAADARQLKSLLHARSWRRPDATDVGLWEDHLAAPAAGDGADANAPAPEVWWIGAGLPEGVTSSARQVLAVQPTLDGSALEVSLAAPAGAARRATLPLPPERAGVALLRGDFMPAPAPTAPRLGARHRPALTHPPVMNLQGSHVAVRAMEGSAMLVFSMPQAGQRHVATPRRHEFSSSRPLVAALLDGRQLGGVGLQGDWLHFWQVPGLAAEPRPPREAFEASADTARWLPMVSLVRPNTPRRTCLVDRQGRLLAWDSGRTAQPAAKGPRAAAPPKRARGLELDRGVLALQPLHPALAVYVAMDANGLWLRRLDAERTTTPAKEPLLAASTPPEKVFIGITTVGKHGRVVTAVAVQANRGKTERAWRLVSSTHSHVSVDTPSRAQVDEVYLKLGESVHGIVRPDPSQPHALVVLAPHRHALWLMTADGTRRPLQATLSPIERCIVDPVCGRIALLTQSRDLYVVDAAQPAPLLIVRGEAPLDGEDHDPPAEDEA